MTLLLKTVMFQENDVTLPEMFLILKQNGEVLSLAIARPSSNRTLHIGLGKQLSFSPAPRIKSVCSCDLYRSL